MTDPSANRKIHLTLGIQSGLKQLTITLGFASGNSQLFPALLNPSSQIVFPVALVISHYLYINKYGRSIMKSCKMPNGPIN